MMTKNFYHEPRKWFYPIAAVSLMATVCLGGQAEAKTVTVGPSRPLIKTKTSVAGKLGTSGAPVTLSYTLDKTGLTSLANNGTSLFTYPGDGSLGLTTYPFFQSPNGSGYYGSITPFSTSLNSLGNTVTAIYAWGSIACQYTQVGNTLKMRFTVTNTTNDLMTTVPINLPELTFPAIPNATMTDSSDYADDDPPTPLFYAYWVDPRYRPGVLLIDYGSAGVVGLCNDDTASMARIIGTGSDNPGTFTRYPFHLQLRPVQGGDSLSTTISLRFAPAGSGLTDVAKDVMQEYSALFPSQLDWDDRRSIGSLFLANDGTPPNYPLNPRGWFNNPNLNVLTPVGYPSFRQALMNYADNAVAELKHVNSQGMLLWDLEGEQYPQPATYIGDPRLLGRLAPEMEYVDASGIATADAFFQKFKDAGLTTGLVIRPQQINFDINGTPHQNDYSQPTKTLMDKIAYAKNRWGVKIFHIDTFAGNGPTDSDVYTSYNAGAGSMDPAILQLVANANPDVLLIPEWKTTRSYAYSSPFASVDLTEGLITTPSVHYVYPGGFVSNLDRQGDRNYPPLHNSLVSGIANGDLLSFDGWYDEEPTNSTIFSMYQQAGTPPVARLTAPLNGSLIPPTVSLHTGNLVVLQATATAAAGSSISKVEFFQTTITGGTVKIGEADTAPYITVWSRVPNGAYVLSVKATDSSGLTRTPATRTIVVGPVSYNFADISGNDVPISGLHAGIDFGTGKWRSNNDFFYTPGYVGYFDYLASSATGKTFTLPAGRFLRSITLTSHIGDTYTLSDGVNPPITGSLLVNTPVTLTTNWRGGGNVITLSFPKAASSGISNISY